MKVTAIPANTARLSAAHWPGDLYEREHLPVRMLQFGTGMLLRGLCAACVDAADRAGREVGQIVALQSTRRGKAATLCSQDGLFTLIERGRQEGQAVERVRLIGSIARALHVEEDWIEASRIAASRDLRVIVTNVSEAGFHEEPFRARLTALLHERFRRLGLAAPSLFVISTELVNDNGPALAAMVDTVAREYSDAAAFAPWLEGHVQFCSSLVDRVVTGAPQVGEIEALETSLGYGDELITICEPYHLWAIQCDPAQLRKAFPVDVSENVVFADSIAALRERKIRLLNGAHTALAPIAILAGIETVHEAVEHELIGGFLRSILFGEIVRSVTLAEGEAMTFARSVVDRFANPWLWHH